MNTTTQDQRERQSVEICRQAQLRANAYITYRCVNICMRIRERLSEKAAWGGFWLSATLPPMPAAAQLSV